MNQTNILGSALQTWSTNPMTGYHRDGFCRPNANDLGKHYVCGLMNQDFLDFTASRGNDLSSVVKAGEKWCLCEDRFEEAHNAGKAPKVIKNATHENTKSAVKNILLREGFENKNKNKIDPGNIFFLIGSLFFIDLVFFDAKYTKSLKKIKIFKKLVK